MWQRLELLVVNAAVRQQGIGSALLRAAEHEARRRGCGNVWLDTFSWQARPFYEQHGYRVFGTLDAYPETHARYVLRKSLADASDETA